MNKVLQEAKEEVRRELDRDYEGKRRGWAEEAREMNTRTRVCIRQLGLNIPTLTQRY
jgi:hypothetical protein